jgi:hypothetical protein
VYLRFAALGDSATVGLGDPVPGGWRGWSRLLSAALATRYDVSYCNLAVSGATSSDVLHRQVDAADRPVPRPRIEVINEVYDEVHATYGGHRIDLAARPDVFERGFMGRRARDLGPWAVRMAWAETRPRRATVRGQPTPGSALEPTWTEPRKVSIESRSHPVSLGNWICTFPTGSPGRVRVSIIV